MIRNPSLFHLGVFFLTMPALLVVGGLYLLALVAKRSLMGNATDGCESNPLYS